MRVRRREGGEREREKVGGTERESREERGREEGIGTGIETGRKCRRKTYKRGRAKVREEGGKTHEATSC